MRRKSLFIICSILLPLILGAGFYCIFFPDVFFVRYLEEITGFNVQTNWNYSNIFLLLFRFYGLDMLWSYALTSALYLLLEEQKHARLWAFFLAFCAGTVMEILQYLGLTAGTFDFLDILAETAAAALGILHLSLWGKFS